MIVVLSQALLALGLLLAGVYYTRRRLLQSLDAGMQSRAMSVAALVRYTEDATGNVYFDDSLLPPSLDLRHPDAFAVWTDRSGLLVRSANWPAGLSVSSAGSAHWNFSSDRIPYRGLRVFKTPVLDREEGSSFHPQTLNIVYLSPRIRMEQQVREAGVFIAGTSLVLLAITVLLALWGIRHGLAPLQELTTQASSISSQNWKLRVSDDLRQLQELRPLADAMQTMLTRLESSFVQQRDFIGNAAHELKTPVAILKSTQQSLLQKPRSPGEYRAGLEHSLDDVQRLEQLLQWMLRLARAEQWAHGALRRDLSPVDLHASCEEAIERVRQLSQSRRISIELSRNGPASLPADPEDLQLVWCNLLENAMRYSPEGESVKLAISNNGSSARITIQDRGMGIASEDLPHVFERFYRGDPSRTRSTGGFGLGLAITKALVEAYGGSIAAESTVGQGTTMVIDLPLTPASQS